MSGSEKRSLDHRSRCPSRARSLGSGITDLPKCLGRPDVARLLRFLDDVMRIRVMSPLVVVFHEEEEPLCIDGGKEVAKRQARRHTDSSPSVHVTDPLPLSLGNEYIARQWLAKSLFATTFRRPEGVGSDMYWRRVQ
jgi:hypothetical protein